MSMICGNIVGGGASSSKTFVIVDGNNNEFTGVVVDKFTLFDATAEDIKLGKVAASNQGVITGVHVCD